LTLPHPLRLCCSLRGAEAGAALSNQRVEVPAGPGWGAQVDDPGLSIVPLWGLLTGRTVSYLNNLITHIRHGTH
jgi:hypothetical protein